MKPSKESEQEPRKPTAAEVAAKLEAVGAQSAELLALLWKENAADIQRKLMETVEEAQRSEKKVKFKVPMSVTICLEEDEVVAALAWGGPKKKRAASLVLSEIQMELPLG